MKPATRLAAFAVAIPWSIFVVAVLSFRYDPWPVPHERVEQFSPQHAWNEMDADVLADVALGEDPDALDAVMWTVINRARLSGRSAVEEVQSGRAYGTRIGDRWVPSWRRAPGRRWRGAPWEWQRARRTALAILEGEIPDPTGGATHFHRSGTWTPPWAPESEDWTEVGRHYFYREQRS
jgi:hypothetical protein